METLESMGLDRYRRGIVAIEQACEAGLALVPRGNEVALQPLSQDYDQDRVDAAWNILKQNKNGILGITSAPESVKQALAESQVALSVVTEWMLDQQDLWDRLERIHRMLSDDSECVRGAARCLPDAIVRCQVCIREKNNE
jgi:hypothetical protein